MRKFLVNLLLSAVALYIVAMVMPGISISGFGAAVMACLVLGIVNAVIKPVFTILTLPITILSLGLFSLVINALMLMLASSLVPGFSVSGFVAAFVGSIVLSLVNVLIVGEK